MHLCVGLYMSILWMEHAEKPHGDFISLCLNRSDVQENFNPSLQFFIVISILVDFFFYYSTNNKGFI